MRRILFKIRQFPHLSETFVLAQIVTALKADFDVTILVGEVLDFKSSTHNEVIKKYGIEKKIILEDYKVPQNRVIRVCKAGFIVLKHIANCEHLLQFLKLKNRFSLTWIYQFHFFSQFREFSVIHIQYGTNVHPVDILKKSGFLKGNLIVSFHGHDAFFPINGFIQNKGYYKHLFWKDNLIVANTPYLAEKIKGLGCPEENIRIIPVGVDVVFFQVHERRCKAPPVKFVNVGRLDKVKGQIHAVEFIRIMRERGNNVELTIIGDGNERENLMQAIENYKLSDVVFLVGKKSQEEVRSYLAESHIYLFPAIPLSDGRRETQGLATLEAAACGLPVLAFDSGGVKYTIEDKKTGYLCAEHDMECLIEKGTCLMDGNLRAEMSKKAREFVEVHFSQKKIDQIWNKIYNSEFR